MADSVISTKLKADCMKSAALKLQWQNMIESVKILIVYLFTFSTCLCSSALSLSCLCPPGNWGWRLCHWVVHLLVYVCIHTHTVHVLYVRPWAEAFSDKLAIDFQLIFAFSALTLLVGQQEGHPACKKQRWGTGVVVCLDWGADLHMA